MPVILQITPNRSVAPLQWTTGSHHQFVPHGSVSVGCHGALNRVEMYFPQPMHDTIAVAHTMSLSLQSVTSSKPTTFFSCSAHEISHLVLNPIWLQEREWDFYFTESTFDPLILFSFLECHCICYCFWQQVYGIFQLRCSLRQKTEVFLHLNHVSFSILNSLESWKFYSIGIGCASSLLISCCIEQNISKISVCFIFTWPSSP